MTAWMISAHTVGEKNVQRGSNQWTPPRSQFRDRSIEICYFCPRDKQLDMDAGWVLWDMLMYKEQGGAAAAERAVQERTGGATGQTWYYDYSVSSFDDDVNEWVDTKHGNGQQCTYGIWEVGKPNKPVIELYPPTTRKASDIITAALLERIDKIYWTSCQAWLLSGGRITRSSQEIYYPPNLPAART